MQYINSKNGLVTSNYIDRSFKEMWEINDEQLKLCKIYDDSLSQIIEDQSINKFAFWRSSKNKLKGLYVYGKVGRGKSAITQIFADTAQEIGLKVKTIQAHNLFSQILQDLAKLSNKKTTKSFRPKYSSNRPEKIIKKLTKKYDILFLDEFFIEDLATALIMGRCLEELFKNSIFLVATSNFSITKLTVSDIPNPRIDHYKKLMLGNLKEFALDGRYDFRHKPSASKTINYGVSFQEKWQEKNPDDSTTIIETGAGKIMLPGTTKGTIKVNVSKFIRMNVSSRDFYKMAQQFKTWFLFKFSKIEETEFNALCRLVSLIDILYFVDAKVFIEPTTEVEEIYKGKRLSSRYMRTKSRIYEMKKRHNFNIDSYEEKYTNS